MIKGIGVSEGVGIGKAFVLEKTELEIDPSKVDNIESEISKFEQAIEICKEQIDELYTTALAAFGESKANIFKAHSMIASDEALITQVKKKIKSESCRATFALDRVSRQFVEIFEGMDDEYMRERAADIKDVSARILRILLGVKSKDLSVLPKGTVIFANDLTPSDTAQLNKNHINGIVTEMGGRTSHTAIMSRTMEIPAIVSVENLFSYIKDGDDVVVDGKNGVLIVSPDQKTMEQFQHEKQQIDARKKALKKQIGLESITKDGYKTILAANIGNLGDAKAAVKNDAEAVGLFRSEFLYMDRAKLPTEDEQFEAYKEVLMVMGESPVTVRTLDIGGDKELPYLDMPTEMNPFLGYRAIRICLDRKDIFITQLRALLRASAFGKLHIMFPMISSVEEIRSAKAILEKCKQELINEKVDISDNIQIGMMIEVPAAAVMADVFADEVDFFSIGTNDLIQYTTAVDRMNNKITHLYNHFHPAVLRLVNNVITSAHKKGKWVAMCGEAAGEPLLIPVLIGMGLDEFSMSANSILNARQIIRKCSKKEMEEIASMVLDFATAKEVEGYLSTCFNTKIR